MVLCSILWIDFHPTLCFVPVIGTVDPVWLNGKMLQPDTKCNFDVNVSCNSASNGDLFTANIWCAFLEYEHYAVVCIISIPNVCE